LLLPSLSFFLVWGVSERGAYTLGSLVFLAVLAGLGVESVIRAQGSGEPAGSSTRESAATRAAGRSTWVLVAMVGCLLLQARTALNEGLAFDTPAAHQAQTERARAAEAAFARPDRPHVLISFDPRGQTVTALAPSILEYRLKGTLLRSLETGRTPAAFADLVLALLRAPRPGPRPEVLLDRGYEPYLAEFAAFEPHIRAMEVALREAFEVEALPGPGGGFWRLEPHGTAPRLAQH
ncbi:MAG: hypothetical protein H8D72_00975, partial [Planctomycetes bacterium]|nr:hypothetical protein [Planctomycetota bacterium]